MENNTSVTTKYSTRHPSPLVKNDIPREAETARPSSTEQLLTEGSRLRATISDFVGRQLTLRLDDGTTVTANTSAYSRLAIGQAAEFEVLSSSPDQLLLKLLTAETENNSSTMAGLALTAAGLNVSDESISLVNTLLDNRLPVDTETLHALARQIKAHPDTDITTLAQMHLKHIPITDKTIAQFEAYAHYEHQLMPKLSEFAQILDSPELAPLLEEAGFTFSDTVIAQEPETSAPLNAASAENTGVPGNTAKAGNATELPGQTAGALAESGAENVLSSGSTGAVASATEGALEQGGISEAASQAENAPAGNAAALQENAPETLNPSLSKTGNTQETDAAQQSVQNNTQEGAEILHSSTVQAEKEAPSGNKFLDHWTLTPKKLTEGKNLEDLYERLERDLTGLSKALKSIKEKHPELGGELSKLVENASKQAENLKDNLDFMNILNRYFPYVQLPVRLKDSYTQGELYVYKRNRGKKSDGSSSVMLHLDMDHLGKTDIYLNLAGKNLTTRFYLEDDTAKLFEAHLSELTDKLTALGLSVNCELLPQVEKEDPVREFLIPPGATETGHFRFDRKA